MTREQALSAWRSYIESSGRLMGELERSLKAESGMEMGDFNVLLILSEAPESRMRMGDLARELAFAPGRLSYRAGVLEKLGWIERSASCEDGRVIWAELTDAGSRALRKARPVHARLVDNLFLDYLNDDEADVLQRVFGALDERLRDLHL